MAGTGYWERIKTEFLILSLHLWLLRLIIRISLAEFKLPFLLLPGNVGADLDPFPSLLPIFTLTPSHGPLARCIEQKLTGRICANLSGVRGLYSPQG